MKKYILFLLLGLIVFSCEKTEDDPPAQVIITPPPPPPPGDPSMNVTKDGVEYSVSTTSNHLSIVTQTTSNPHNSMYVETFIGGYKLSIKAKSYHFQNPPEEGVRVKKYSTNTNDNDEETEFNECGNGPSDFICDKGNVYYYYTELYQTRAIQGKPYGLVEITYIDTINYVVSGNFNATVYEMFEFYPDSMVFSGEFENQPYSIEFW